MDPVYRKTSKGQEAIAQRAHGVVGRARSLLILVDGQRAQSSLLTLAAGLGDIAQMLAQLETDGLIAQHGGGAAVVRPASPSADAGPNPEPAAVTLPKAKLLASRQLMVILGPTSEPLCLRIEETRNRAEFITAIHRAYAVVAEIRGRAQADAFGNFVEANLPPD